MLLKQMHTRELPWVDCEKVANTKVFCELLEMSDYLDMPVVQDELEEQCKGKTKVPTKLLFLQLSQPQWRQQPQSRPTAQKDRRDARAIAQERWKYDEEVIKKLRTTMMEDGTLYALATGAFKRCHHHKCSDTPAG